MSSLFTFSQLLIMTPIILVYLAGIALAAVAWRRAPRACALAMSGLAIMLMNILVGTAIRGWIIGNPGAGGIASISQKLMVVAIAGTVLGAVGMALLIAAVFVDRRAEHLSGFELPPAAAAPSYGGRIHE